MGTALSELIAQAAYGKSSWKQAVRAVSTLPISLTGLQTIDGVTLAAGDSVLVVGQANGAQNGPYVAANGAWYRRSDFDASSDAQLGSQFLVMEGVNAGTVWRLASPTQGSISLGVTSLSFALSSEAPALLPSLTDPGNGPGFGGSNTAGTLTYASSIDSALTTLAAPWTYNAGVAAAVGTNGKMPVFLVLHGYNGSSVNISSTVRNRIASHGFFCLVPDYRGRNGGPGSPDDSARELQDIADAIAAVAADGALSLIVDTSKVHVLGLSGGGANALALAARYPGLARTVVCCFGWGDYGVDPVGSFFGASPSDQTTIQTRIGARYQDLEPYRTRNANRGIAQSLKASAGTSLYMLWDSADPIGVLLRDTKKALQADASLAPQWYADESTVGSSPRWSHGYYEDNADLLYAEHIIYNRRALSAPSMTEQGSLLVQGHCVTPQFEVWIGGEKDYDPRNGGSGGRSGRARVSYDVASHQYEVEAISGPMCVAIRRRDTGAEIARVLNASQPSSLDLSNVYTVHEVIPDAVSSFSAFWGPLEGPSDPAENGDVLAAWDERSGIGNDLLTTATVSSTPAYYATPTPGGRVLVTGGAKLACVDNLLPSSDFGFAVIFSPGNASDQAIIGWGDDTTATNANVSVITRSTGFSLRVLNAAGTDWLVTDTVTVNTSNFYLAICEKSNSLSSPVWHLTINGRTTVTSSAPTGTFLGTRLTAGVVQQGATSLFAATCSLRAFARVSGRRFTDGERARLYRAAQLYWGVT